MDARAKEGVVKDRPEKPPKRKHKTYGEIYDHRAVCDCQMCHAVLPGEPGYRVERVAS